MQRLADEAPKDRTACDLHWKPQHYMVVTVPLTPHPTIFCLAYWLYWAGELSHWLLSMLDSASELGNQMTFTKGGTVSSKMNTSGE